MEEQETCEGIGSTVYVFRKDDLQEGVPFEQQADKVSVIDLSRKESKVSRQGFTQNGYKTFTVMKHLISLNGDGNQVAFIRGNDGDISISFDLPSKDVYWESVRVGVGNSGGQPVPGYVKDALIQVCDAMMKWENEE